MMNPKKLVLLLYLLFFLLIGIIAVSCDILVLIPSVGKIDCKFLETVVDKL